MIGTLHHPPAAGALMLQMLQEAQVELIGRQMTRLIQPMPVARNIERRIEPQAAKDVRGDFAAFLRRRCIERVQVAEFRREPLEGAQLPSDTPRTRVPATPGWIRV